MDLILWGRADCTSGQPIRIMSGSPAEVRHESRFRESHAHRVGAFHDLRTRELGQPYDTGASYRVPQPTIPNGAS